ncbi:MAG: formyltransferase family protein [Dehalococcoidia bacterium]|nr:formyltransferase family protein [Dehalococcoidia bacterium]
MGFADLADPPLRALLNAESDVVLAVTQPDRPAGRGSRLRPPPVKVLAESHGVDVFQPESLKDPGAQACLRSYRPDLIVVAASWPDPAARCCSIRPRRRHEACTRLCCLAGAAPRP